MGSVLAILSAAAFAKARDAAGRALRLGSIYPVNMYVSANPVIAAKLTADLYLVTVREGRLWLVGALRRPKFAKATGWRGRANVVPVTDITCLIPRLTFDSGAGVNPAKLAMALQTPRGLTDDDVALIEQAVAASPASARAAITPGMVEAAVVRVTALVLDRTESAVRADQGRYAAFQEDDSFAAEELDWKTLTYEDEEEVDPDDCEVFGRRDYDLEMSLFNSEQFSEASTDKSLRPLFQRQQGELYGRQLQRLVRDDRVEADDVEGLTGRIRGGDSLIEAMSALLMLRDPGAIRVAPAEFAEVHRRWAKFIGTIEPPTLRAHLGMFFQSAQAARCTGALFDGRDDDREPASPDYVRLASWSLGEGQGRCWLARIVDDEVAPVPAFTGAALIRKPPPPLHARPLPGGRSEALLRRPLRTHLRALKGYSELRTLLGDQPDEKLAALLKSDRGRQELVAAVDQAIEGHELHAVLAVATRCSELVVPRWQLPFEVQRTVALARLRCLSEALVGAWRCLELFDRPRAPVIADFIDRSRLHNEVAWISYLQGDVASAVTQAERAVKERPSNSQAVATLAVARYEAGDHKKAFALLRKVMTEQIDPEPIGALLRDPRYHDLCIRYRIPIELTDEDARTLA